MATLRSQEDDFTKAADIFESLGHESLESKLGAYSAKGYFFQSVLCHMAAGDNVAATGKLESFKATDYNFPSSRECQFLEKLVAVGVHGYQITYLICNDTPANVLFMRAW